MLEAIRKHAKGWIAKIILGLIASTFALFGVNSYMKDGDSADVVASVGKVKITRQEFTRELQNQTDRMREALAEKFDRSVTETPEFRKKVLDALLERKALLQDAQQQGFRPPDRYVESVLMQIPAFQENGAFSPQRFEALLRQRGMTPAGFEKEVKDGYVLEAQTSPIALGTFSNTTSLAQFFRVITQQREISLVDLPSSEVSSKLSVSDADIQSYYASHQANFTEPEKIRAEYLTLTADAAMPGIVVSEKEINDYYQQNAARLSQPEQRTASHVLITVAKGAEAATKARARAKAVQLTAALQKAPASFAEVARKESQDPGSAAQNGSLGSFGRGAMVKPFDEAVFSMKPGEIRGPVESEFGFHIIRLDSIQPATVAPLESVRAEIEAGLRKQKAQKKFSELAENFSNLVYEKAQSLKPAADALKLTVQTTDWMSAKNAPPPFLNSKLGEVIFSADSIKSKQNTEAIEVAPGVLLAARVLEHRPAALRTLQEVKASVEQKLRNERSAKLMAERGDALIKQLRLGTEAGLHWSDFKIISRQQNAGLDPNSLTAIFRADVAKLPAYTGLLNPDGSYRIVRINRVLENTAQDPALSASIKTGIQQAIQRADLEAMVKLAKSGQKVEIREGALEQK
jgi:peptidyl-prolyl cis-trans isomerase D